MFRSHRGLSVCLTAWALAAGAARAGADDVYFHRTVSELKITEGRLPEAAQGQRTDGVGGNWRLRPAVVAYAAIDGAGEVYLDVAPDPRGANWTNAQLTELTGNEVVAFRVPDRPAVNGRLFAPKKDGSGMVAVSFEVTRPAAQDDGKAVFARARRRHYERLLERGLPGAPWFRHQVREAQALQPGPGGQVANVRIPEGATGLEQTFNLFSGGRAIDENLQLDRPMGGPASNPTGPGAGTVKAESLNGISVAEIDWEAKLKGKTMKGALDPLSLVIPADQHAVFLPGLKAAAAVLAQFRGDAIPVLNLAEPRSEDRGVVRRYERQLGASLDDLARFAGRTGVKGLAVTGSDPYLPSGTDLAVLVETDEPDELAALLRAKLGNARRSNPGAVDDGGEVAGVRYEGARTPDRALGSYVAVVDRVVVVTNSKVQLGRLVEAARGKTPRLAEAPEYRFFRDRYARGDAAESAFVVLTDATIRRWCGPRWRIGSSRRVRAAAAMDEVQAVNLAAVANGSTGGVTPKAPAGSIDLGALHLGRAGVRSEVYGTLDFLTPIAELPLDEVGRAEADAYLRWRDGYQQNWRGVFDPIAVRLSARPDRLAADLTVMPLIVGTNYRPFVELVGAARLAADAGDRHPGSLLHAVMALDLESKLIRSGGDQIANLTRVPQQVALGWLGGSIALYLDDDPFWAELGAADDPQVFLNRSFPRLPIGLRAEVTDGIKLTLFLTGLRAFIDQSAPNVTVWSNHEHRGKRYVRVTEAEGARPRAGRPKIALFYYGSPRSLTLSLNEDVVKRAIEREAKAQAEPQPEPGPAKGTPDGPWLGESLALRVSRRGFEALGVAGRTPYREELQLRSWSNLPILNEWKRLFPDRDPVAVHQAVWGTTPVDPGGGRYVWNAAWSTMESTTFGHPGEPKEGHETNNPLSQFGSADFGVSFEDGGLRTRTEVELLAKP